MKKFIAAFDGLDFSQSTLNYAVHLASNCRAHLVGVFLDDFTRRSYGVADITTYEGSNLDKHMEELNEKDSEERSENVDKFEKACQNAGISYAVHRDRNLAIQELLHESVYADLVIVSMSETLTRFEESFPTRFLRELLNDVQCSVLVVPAVYRPIDKIALLYDGEPSSVFAIRSFSNLLEPLNNLHTEVITVRKPETSLYLPDSYLLKEFIKRHYPNADYVVLKGVPEDEIINYLRRGKNDPVVVLGAYRRGKFSRLLKPSMADYLMQYVKLPLFIAHNKS